MPDLSDTLRQTIVGLIRILSCADAQVAYERDVPIAQVPAELVCMWFDDHYHPDSAAFLGAFTARERAALAAFHATFSRVRASLPDAIPTVASLHARPEWLALMRAAADTLSRLGEDG